MKKLFILLAMLLTFGMVAQSNSENYLALRTGANLVYDTTGANEGVMSTLEYTFQIQQDQQFAIEVNIGGGYFSYYSKARGEKRAGGNYYTTVGFSDVDNISLHLGGGYHSGIKQPYLITGAEIRPFSIGTKNGDPLLDVVLAGNIGKFLGTRQDEGDVFIQANLGVRYQF